MAFVGSEYQGGPLKQLFGFQRVHLNPGESVQVFFSTSPTTFSTVDKTGSRWVFPGKYKITVTNGMKELAQVVEIIGEPTLIAAWKRP